MSIAFMQGLEDELARKSSDGERQRLLRVWFSQVDLRHNEEINQGPLRNYIWKADFSPQTRVGGAIFPADAKHISSVPAVQNLAGFVLDNLERNLLMAEASALASQYGLLARFDVRMTTSHWRREGTQSYEFPFWADIAPFELVNEQLTERTLLDLSQENLVFGTIISPAKDHTGDTDSETLIDSCVITYRGDLIYDGCPEGPDRAADGN